MNRLYCYIRSWRKRNKMVGEDFIFSLMTYLDRQYSAFAEGARHCPPQIQPFLNLPHKDKTLFRFQPHKIGGSVPQLLR